MVLQLEPDNAEAIRALGLRPYGGMMLTQGQIERLKGQTQGCGKRWTAGVRWWPNGAGPPNRGDPALPAAVREKLSKISDAAEMVGLEGALWRQVGAKQQRRPYHDMVLAMVLALGDNPQPVAAESLARYGGLLRVEGRRCGGGGGAEAASAGSLRAAFAFRPAIADRGQGAVDVQPRRRPGDEVFYFPGGGAGRRVVAR